jgi:hypothetical protein
LAWDLIPNPQELARKSHVQAWAIFLSFTFLYTQTALAQPPVRRFDDPGSPPFNMLQAGENPPLDVDGNFVIGPEYTRP